MILLPDPQICSRAKSGPRAKKFEYPCFKLLENGHEQQFYFSELFLAALALSSAASAFRFMGGESEDHGAFGEAGLNAIPRIGRRSIGGNPFDSRFRLIRILNKSVCEIKNINLCKQKY